MAAVLIADAASVSAANPLEVRVCPPGARTRQEQEAPARQLPSQLTSENFATGYAFDEGFVKFNLSSPVKRQKLFGFKELILAGCNVGSDLLAVTYDYANNGEVMFKDLVRMDLATGKFTVVTKVPDDSPMFLDMTYDKGRNTVYALVVERGASKPSLAKMNKDTGELTVITRFDRIYYSMACDEAGRLFLVENTNGALSVIIDPTADPRPVKVGGGNAKGAAYVSSMAMDHDAYKLYWAMCAADQKTYLMEINPATGVASQISTLGLPADTREIMAMNIDRRQKADGAPSAPENLIVEPDASGEPEANVSWKNPVRMNAGGTGVLALYRNGVRIKEYDNVVEGAAMSCRLTDLPQGYNHFRIVAENSVGEGVAADAYVWIGRDVPRGVSDVKLARQGNKAVLSWKAPERSVHGGYMNPSNLKYRIVRISSTGDSTVVAKTHRQTEFSEVITSPDIYRYAIQSLSTDYGDVTDSPSLYLGNAMSIPYSCDFSTDKSFNMWIRHDGNGDGSCWQRMTRTPYYAYNRPKDTDADDWLISPPVSLEAGKDYVFYFEYVGGLGEFYPKRFAVTSGPDSDFKNHKVIKEFNIAIRGTQKIRVTVHADKTGEYCVGLHDISVPTTSNLCVANVRLEEKKAGKLSGSVVDKEGNPVAGALVTVIGTDMSCVSDEEGEYEIDYLQPGSYRLSAVKFGYKDFEGKDYLNVTLSSTTQFTIVMENMPVYVMRGKVCDSDGNAVHGALVKLSGEEQTLETRTTADGSYRFDEIAGSRYNVEIARLKYRSVRDTIDLAADLQRDYTMNPSVLQPACFAGRAITEGVGLSWRRPYEIFRRDNGKTPVGQGGAVVGDENYLFGTVWRQPAEINAISWMTTDYRGPHNEMNLWLLDITPDGIPTNKVLYCALHVPAAGDLKWSKHQLPETVKCPNGFYLAVSYSFGMASLATADGKDAEWPFVPYVNYRSTDYRTNSWVCTDASFVRNNYMIRAEGEGIGVDGSEYPYRYLLYRLRPGQEENTSAWKLLSPESGLAAESYVDPVAGLEKGEYRYALRALYPEEKMSDPVLTEIIKVDPAAVGSVTSGSLRAVYDKTTRTLRFTDRVVRATLTDLSGRVRIGEKDVDAMDLSGLESGIYIVRANNSVSACTSKIIINK